MPIIYGVLPSPPTRSAIVTAKLVGLEFSLKKVDLLNVEHKSPEYLKINPTHTVPVFEDDDGFRIFDSHSIVTYILEKYAKDDGLYPKDLKQRANVNSMLHFNNSSLWSSITGHFGSTMIYGKPVDPDRLAFFEDKMNILNNILEDRSYAAGDKLTVADICIMNSLTAPLATNDFHLSKYPNVEKWFEKLKKEISCYDEIVAKGTEELRTYFKLAAAAYKARTGK